MNIASRSRRRVAAAVLALAVLCTAARAFAQNLLVSQGLAGVLDYHLATLDYYTYPSNYNGPPNYMTGGMAVAGNNVFISWVDSTTNYTPWVGVYNAATGAAVNANFAPAFGTSLALADGLLFVGANGTTQVGVYSQTTGAQVGSYPGAVQGGTVGVATWHDTLYVSSSGDGTVRALDAVTGQPVSGFNFAGGVTSPMAMTVADGHLFVADDANGSISEYDALTGTLIHAALISGLAQPRGMTVGDGHLFVTELNNAAHSGSPTYGLVGEYDAATGAVITPQLNYGGLLAPLALAYLPVPEPGTWTLVTVAVGLGWVAARRRCGSVPILF